MLKTASKLIQTDNSILPTVARLSLGSVMFAHGAQKALGWFGGHGYEGTMGFLTQGVGLPAALAFLVIAIEFLGAAALIVGFGGRLAALGIGAVMVGAVFTAHLSNGFFMNWSGAQGGEGFEYHILAIALAAVVTIAGSGAYSIDRWLGRRLAEGSHATVPSPHYA
jgi:putative oxidoreductase